MKSTSPWFPHGFPMGSPAIGRHRPAFAQEEAIRQAPARGDGHRGQLVAGAGDLKKTTRLGIHY